MATVLIGADICPIGENRPFFQAGDAQKLFSDLLSEFKSADLVVANLEGPFIERPSPILKTGPTFGESGDCINGIKTAGIDLLCLANNHILDHGPAGLRHTLEVCARAGIDTVGAGENLAAARQILVREVGGRRIGILAMAEHEFSIATRDSWGANPLDLIDFVRNVKENRDRFDYLIVLLHGSHEFFAPTPRIKDTCHFLIEMGANAVVVQQPHVLGGYEDYQGGHIVYGQGALVMDEAIYRQRKSFHQGFLVRLSIQKTEDGGRRAEDGGRGADSSRSSNLQSPTCQLRSTMEIVPFVQSDPVPGARRLRGDEEVQFRRDLEERSRAILDDAFVHAEWLRFCQARKHGYISALLGHGRILRRLNAGGLVARLLCGKSLHLGVRNCVCCETHREALETIFNQHLV